jgi:hypothetical protein
MCRLDAGRVSEKRMRNQTAQTPMATAISRDRLWQIGQILGAALSDDV